MISNLCDLDTFSIKDLTKDFSQFTFFLEISLSYTQLSDYSLHYFHLLPKALIWSLLML